MQLPLEVMISWSLKLMVIAPMPNYIKRDFLTHSVDESNSFRKYNLFEYPKFELNMLPKFSHIIDLYNVDLSKPVKIAFYLNDECLNRQKIKKQELV